MTDQNGQEELKKKRKLDKEESKNIFKRKLKAQNLILKSYLSIKKTQSVQKKKNNNLLPLVWPIEQVQVNFKRFVEMTNGVDKEQPDIMNEFSQDVEFPTEEDILAVFESSLQKIQGRQNKKKWKDNEKSLLNFVITRYCLTKKITPKILVNISHYNVKNDEDWRNIAKLIVGRNATQCKYKWLAKSKFKLVQIPWTQEEDDALRSTFQQQFEYQRQGKHNKWSDIAKEIALRCKTTIVRQGKQCRERWINKLDPSISKGPWARNEELKLLKLILLKGKKWSEISKILKNIRTENSLKNRYHTLIKKEKNKGKVVEQIPQSQISEIISTLQLQPEFPIDAPHLYEDIDAQELQMIIRLIKRLENEVPDEEVSEEPQNIQSSEKKEEGFGKEGQIKIRQKFLEELNNVKAQVDNSVQCQLTKNNDQQEKGTDESSILTALKSLVQQQNQEGDIDYKAIEQYYLEMMKNVDPNAEYHVEPFSTLEQNELNDCSFALVDFCNSQLHVFPTQFLNAVVNKLKDSTKQQHQPYLQSYLSSSPQQQQQPQPQLQQQPSPSIQPQVLQLPQLKQEPQPQQQASHQQFQQQIPQTMNNSGQICINSQQSQMMQQMQYVPMSFMYPMYQQLIPMMMPYYIKQQQPNEVQVKSENGEENNLPKMSQQQQSRFIGQMPQMGGLSNQQMIQMGGGQLQGAMFPQGQMINPLGGQIQGPMVNQQTQGMPSQMAIMNPLQMANLSMLNLGSGQLGNQMASPMNPVGSFMINQVMPNQFGNPLGNIIPNQNQMAMSLSMNLGMGNQTNNQNGNMLINTTGNQSIEIQGASQVDNANQVQNLLLSQSFGGYAQMTNSLQFDK